VSFIKRTTSAIGKLIIVMTLAATFLFGMVGVVYMSLQGEEIKVPEIVGKDFVQIEKELADLGLRVKKRADRYSEEKPNTVLEQLPKAGDTVKTGQMILVVTSKTNPEGQEAPATIKKSTTEEEKEDTEKIEELISDKPKKTGKSNSNTASNKKKSSTTRDVLTNNSNSNSSTTGDKTNSNSTSGNKNSTTTTPTNKTSTPGDTKKPGDDSTKPNNKPPGSGDLRQRKSP
jgi:beta-lactam-binding protein with PASTA domain